MGNNGSSVPLSEAQLDVLAQLSPADEPATVDLGGELGEYRAIVSGTPVAGESLIVALPLADVRDTVLRLNFVVQAIGLLAVLIAAFAGALAVRVALRPLDRVAGTAHRVSKLQLDRGAVALAARASPDDADPRLCRTHSPRRARDSG